MIPKVISEILLKRHKRPKEDFRISESGKYWKWVLKTYKQIYEEFWKKSKIKDIEKYSENFPDI
jgi:hypothetical protein